MAARLRKQGMTVEIVPGTGHTVFRDEHAGFMSTIGRWLAHHVPVVQPIAAQPMAARAIAA